MKPMCDGLQKTGKPLSFSQLKVTSLCSSRRGVRVIIYLEDGQIVKSVKVIHFLRLEKRNRSYS